MSLQSNVNQGGIMEHTNVIINTVQFKRTDDSTTLQLFIDATISIENKEYDVNFSEGALSFMPLNNDRTLRPSREIRTYLKDLLTAYAAGATARISFLSNISISSYKNSTCKLEED